MAHTSSMVFAGIAPHPPIMVPEVGGDAIADVRHSIDAMEVLTQRLIRSGAETVVLVSPHAPLERDAFVAYGGLQLHADFANFRAPDASVHAELDSDLLEEMTRVAASRNFSITKLKGRELDHGIAVPLYFLQRYGWHGKVVALGYSFLSNADHLRFGECIRQAIEGLGRPVAFIASGDLSHRLTRAAPAGYDPQAHLFDEEVVDAIHRCETRRIVEIDPHLRSLAGECGYRSMLVAIGVARDLTPSCEVISYEAPFGVGYLVAQLYVAGGADVPSTQRAQLSVGEELPALARQVVETFVTEGRVLAAPAHSSELLDQRAGCFVSIKTHAGELRGCIGTVESETDTLTDEIIQNAIGAATHDPRFTPVRINELPGLRYSVDVLTQPERVKLEDLDPQVYGVIVEDRDGSRRGLLLPNLQGIETAAQQVEIASRKAGIAQGEEVQLWRFRSERYREE
jgi:AmmeMemoRadiSam system protein A/AmmeMemoRadiSam system protein B